MIEEYIYDFKPRCAIVMAPWELERFIYMVDKSEAAVKAGHGRMKIGIKRADKYIEARILDGICRGYFVRIDPGVFDKTEIDWEKMYVVSDEGVSTVEIRSEKYYKLLPTVPTSYPSLEISGIHMHRIWNSDPRQDTIQKIRAARIRRGDIVLDTCMGLGYTAIWSAKRGALRVYTVEIDPNVIDIAEQNPWSWELDRDSITTIKGDVTRIIRGFPDNFFDKIIHDPPRISTETGDLYGSKFYRELYRVLKPGGVLFHYTGNPGKKRKGNFPGRVASRLKSVGFSKVLNRVEEVLGIVAFKE